MAELVRTFRAPYEVLICVYVNAILTTVLYFFAPSAIYSLFFSVKGLLFFPAVLSSWMLADVPATNELAPDSSRVLAALGNDEQQLLLLRSKHLVLWLLVTPIAIAAAAITGAQTDRWTTIIMVMIYVATVPFASLGISCFVGILWPYHPISLKVRWEQRHQFRRMILRWSILVVSPYLLVPAFGFLCFVPSAIIWEIVKPPHATRISDLAIFLGLALSAPVAFLIWSGGTKRAVKLIAKREDRLRAYLSDPSLG